MLRSLPCCILPAFEFVNKKRTTEEQTQTVPGTPPDSSATGEPSPAQTVASESNPAMEELKAKAARADENWDRFVRLNADFDNYRKRAARERTDAVRYANEALVEKLLPILDNFDAALTATQNVQQANIESLKAGVTMIQSQLRGALVEAGLEELDALQKPFDPTWQEAISQQETADAPEGQVVQQLRKGYRLRERLIRPASVIVAKKRA